MRIELIAPSMYNGQEDRKGIPLSSDGPADDCRTDPPPQHSVTITDENIAEIDYDKDVDLVGISAMTATSPRAYEVAPLPGRAGRYRPSDRLLSFLNSL